MALAIVMALLLSLPGCDEGTLYLAPYVLEHEGVMLCAVQTTIPGETHAQFSLYASTKAPYRQWEPQGKFLGRLAGLLPGEGTVRFVFQDGAVQERPLPLKEEESATRLQGQGDLRLEAVAHIGKTVYAVDASAGRSLQMMLLRDDGWQPHGPPLPVFGAARFVQVVSIDHDPVLLWRNELQGVREKGLQIWRLARGEEWTALSVPDAPTQRSAFAAVNVDDAQALLLVRLLPQETQMASLDAWVLRDGVWSVAPHTPPLSEMYAYSQIYSMSLASSGGHLQFAQSDAGGVLVQTADASGASPWSVPAAVVDLGANEPGTLTGPLTAFLLGVFLVLMIRRWFMRSVERATGQSTAVRYAGGLASPIDRGVAFFFDMILMTPLPLMFFQYGVDVPPLVALSRNPGLLFVLWMGGVAVYAGVSERVWGQTLGKRLMRLRVCHLQGGRISTLQAFVRNLLRFIDFFPVPVGGASMPYLIALLTSSFSRRRQRVGDLLASTVVVKYVPLDKRQVVLASASPRRRELLAGLGLSFTVVPADADETPNPTLRPDEVALDLARRKATAVANRLDGSQLIIAADTLVALETKIIGKPEDDDDARAILRELSGKMHQVYTGVAIIDRATGQTLSAVERTDVRMRPLTEDEIDAYVASGEAHGKAGAYAIQENADKFVQEVRGSLSNVIGLPMELLRQMLNEVDG